MANRPDEVQCPCCKLFYPSENPKLFAPRTVPLNPTHGICWDCMSHQGDDAYATQHRGRQHGQMLRREYAEARRERDEAVAAAEEMRRELAMRPVQKIVQVENLDKLVVEDACQQRDEAYRRRDVAMGALSDVRMHHHKNPDAKRFCSCGLIYKNCDMAQVADRWDGVRWWEESQAGKAYKGQRHHLDLTHPAAKDPEWLKTVYGS